MTNGSAASAFSLRHPGASAARVVNFAPPTPRITINDTSSDWARGLEARLETLIQLCPGWDGYQALPVSFTTAVFALNMLDRLFLASVPPPDLVPGYGGDIQAEWHIGGTDIELHVKGPNNVLAWRANAATGEEGEEVELKNDFTVVGEWIKQLADSANAVAAAAA